MRGGKKDISLNVQKIGDPNDCSNYRGITLLDVSGKVFNWIILNRMKEVDDKLRDQQAGFRKISSCTAQIATLRIIIEQCAEWNSSLYVGFIDYEKAFDSIDRKIIWKLLRHNGKLVNTGIIRNSYEHHAAEDSIVN
ncbi:uncharacterized protein LOC134250003 [Saccostrea cucullata]|uniref:uncharacterized protein LOC134250003 n=1 Tax=Saccostrea cuccullata TaxID=36930 RepID=UPI002ED14129